MRPDREGRCADANAREGASRDPHLTALLRSLCHPLTPLAPASLQGHFGVSASTGSFGDTHVVYSFQLADLEDGDIHEVEATPYTGTDKTSHRVHLDSKSHETHVKVTPATIAQPTLELLLPATPTPHHSPLTIPSTGR